MESSHESLRRRERRAVIDAVPEAPSRSVADLPTPGRISGRWRGNGTLIRRVPSAPTGRPEVTVLVPAYNYARYLPACVQSVLSQEHVEVRVVIVDDCSTDDTPAVTARLGEADARVKVIRHEPNRGHIPSVNEGLEHVETKYLVKLDADDLLAPGSLARAAALLEAHPEVGFVYGRPGHFSGPEPQAAATATRSWTVWSGQRWLARRCQTANNVISQPEVVMRTENVLRTGGVREDLPHTSDLHMWLQLAAGAEVGRINGPIQGWYRVHAASMQRTVHAGELFGLQARRDAFAAALLTPSSPIARADELWGVVRRSLATEALDRACHEFERGRVDEDGEPIAGFVAFALDTWPDAASLEKWAMLERCRAIGLERARRHPLLFADAVRRRATAEASMWRWRRTGET